MFQAIRMCLWPNMNNGNNTRGLLVSLGFASGTKFTLGIIPKIRPNQALVKPNLISDRYFTNVIFQIIEQNTSDT